MLLDIYNKLLYYNKKRREALCPFDIDYYDHLIFCEIDKLSVLKNDYRKENQTRLELTISELAEFNGTEGKPAYILVHGIIYDVSNEASWGGGTHFGLYSGKDLSEEFDKCHGDISMLDKLPKIGTIKK